MYSKDEVKTIKTLFWSSFKSKIEKHRSVSGRRINWLHYPSEIDHIYIRLDADKEGARFSFDIQGKDLGVRSIIWEQMYELKVVLEKEMGTDGKWLEAISNETVPEFNRIIWEITDVNLFSTADHKKITQFLMERILSFDRFYQEFKDILTNLAN